MKKLLISAIAISTILIGSAMAFAVDAQGYGNGRGMGMGRGYGMGCGAGGGLMMGRLGFPADKNEYEDRLDEQVKAGFLSKEDKKALLKLYDERIEYCETNRLNNNCPRGFYLNN